MDSSPPPSTPPPASGGQNVPPRKLTPVMMQGLLAAAAPAGPASRAWEPPGRETLQGLMPQYEIAAFIARGGMGAVYRGVHRTLQRPVAIKVLSPEADTGGLNQAERFKRETQAMARLNHPNIVTVYDAGEVRAAPARSDRSLDASAGEPSGGVKLISKERADGHAGPLLYFVMEYVEGTDVRRLIAAEGRLDARRAARIIYSMCQALGYAHGAGIIHRDIKPSNILIDRNGHVKVADFGLAKSLNADGSIVTRSDVALGSPDFVAPEALLGLALDQRADLFAVGVMLYQMLTGRIPRGSYELPSQIVPGLGKRFDAIVSKAMQTDRDLRYRTAEELKQALAKALPDLRSSDGRVGSLGGEVPSGRRGVRSSVGLAATAALLGFGAGAFLLRSAGRPTVEAEVSRPPAGPSSASSKATGRQWRRITFQQDEFLRDGGATVMPDGSLRISRGVEFTQLIPCQNMAVKARVERSSGAEISGIRLRIKGTPQVSIFTDGARAWLDTENVIPPQVPARAMKLPSDSAEPMELQLVVIDQRAYGIVDSVALSPLDLESHAYVGSAGIWSSNGVFDNLHFIPLDGLSEADALSVSGVTTTGR